MDQRLSAGSVVPAGDCPECGAFAYLVGPNIYTFVIMDKDGNDYVEHQDGASVKEACEIIDSGLQPDDFILAVFEGELHDARNE